MEMSVASMEGAGRKGGYKMANREGGGCRERDGSVTTVAMADTAK